MKRMKKTKKKRKKDEGKNKENLLFRHFMHAQDTIWKKNHHNRESILFKDTLTVKRSLVSINYFVNFYSTNRNFQFIEDESIEIPPEIKFPFDANLNLYLSRRFFASILVQNKSLSCISPFSSFFPCTVRR